jgi:hypothetical protein
MSPAKKARNLHGNALTVEFSGICTLVWDRKAGTAAVRMVDLASAGFARHYAGLGREVTASSPRGFKGPDPDASISVLGEDKDIGIWNLLGADVDFVGATGKLTVDDKKVDVTKRPDAAATSVKWLPDVSFLSESRKIDPVCPTAAIIRLPAGHVTAIGSADTRMVEFVEDGEPVGPIRYCLPRFQVVIPFAEELAVRLSRERVFRLRESMTLMMSNTCVCNPSTKGPREDFYAHYDVVQAKRRPTLKPAVGPDPAMPDYPEWCWAGFVQAG